MNQRLLCTLAWRNVWRHPRRTFLTVLALALGLTFLLFSLGLNDGGHAQMIANGIKLGGGHVLVQAQDYQRTRSQDLLLSLPTLVRTEELLETHTGSYPLAGISPRLLASGLLSSAASAAGVGIVGVRPTSERSVSLIPQRMIEGAYFTDGNSSSLVIGSELARKLKVRLGSKVVLMAQSIQPAQESALSTDNTDGEIRSSLFRVSGIFQTGLRAVDAYVIHMSLADTQSFLGATDSLTQIAIFLQQENSAPPVASLLREQLSPASVEVLTWRESLAELAQFVWLDDAFGYVMNGMLLGMVALGLLNTMLMAVLERRYEFGVCTALGLRPVHMLSMVVYESLVLIIFSLLLGLLLGLGVHTYFATYGLDIRLFTETDFPVAGTVFDPIMYSHLSIGRIVWATGTLSLLAAVMALYPAWKAARTELPDALRIM
jgi:putative ABC transport system permease protein